MLFSLPWPLRWSTAIEQPSQVYDEQTQADRDNALQALLRHYDTTSLSSLPPSARIDPSLRQQERQPLRLLDIWKYGAFVFTKSTEIAIDVLRHYVKGPKRKSWGLEMTLITSFMRNVGNHSHLADITMLRALINIAGYVPLPSDAMVTPVTFRVNRLNLRGILSEYDSLEPQSRELSGEWVVGKELWKRLQAEWKASQKDRRVATHKSARHRKDRVILYLHGGAYYMFSATTHRQITIQLSKYTGSRIFAVDYRLAPETRFPGQLHDAVVTYMRLLNDLHIPPENILVAGDSAGGGLSLALLMYLRDNKYPLPSGAILMSPWVDLTMSCDSWDCNADYDVVPMPRPGDHLNPVSCYLGDDLDKYVTHPYASPLFGDFHGLPPLLIQSGDSEVLRDEITLLAYKASMSGVNVRHELYEDAVHVFQTFPFLECSRKAFLSCREFVKKDLALSQERAAQRLHTTSLDELDRDIDNERTRPVRGDGQEMPDADKQLAYSREGANDFCGSEPESDVERPSWARRRSGQLFSQFAVAHHSEGIGSPPRGLSPYSPKYQSSRLSIVDDVPRPVPRPFASTAKLDTPPIEDGSTKAIKKDRPRNHRRGETAGQLRLSSMATSSISSTPMPTIRSRSRAISHPDIFSLCQEWASEGSNQTTRYIPSSQAENPVMTDRPP